MSITRHHNEWLSLVPNSGPFLSLPVLAQAFPQGLDAHDADHARRLRMAFVEWDDNQLGQRPDQGIHQTWIKLVLAETLGYDTMLAEKQAIPQTLRSEIVGCGETLRPDWIVNDPTSTKARLLVQVYPRSQSLTKPLPKSRSNLSPDTRMMQLLRDSGIRLGIVTNGDHWMLVNAPKNETTGYASWYANLWLEEPVTLRAFRTLLGADRLFSVPEDETLEALLDKSAADQQEVTDQLGYQVRKAVEVLIQSIAQLEHDPSSPKELKRLISDVDEKVLYESALTVMMRLVFLFCAEERELLLLGDDLYDKNYAVSTLREQLRVTADQFGEEILGLRYDAWTRLLTSFRAVYAGVKHDRFRLPPYGGSLFHPDRFPFLEGRPERRNDRGEKINNWREEQATPLPVSNRTVLHLLEALQVLQVRLPGGGAAEARKLSFRELNIEQIGHVYEGLLDHTAKRAAEPVLGLAGTRNKEPEIPLAELEKIAAKGEKELLKFLKDETGRSESALNKGLNAEIDDQLASRFRTACQDSDLWKRVKSFAGLVRLDTVGYPVVITTGSVFVTAGTDRRSSGTHYTPKSLTEPIVQYTLEPLVYVGPAEGLPKDQWKLRSAKELLDLKICDMACGSGAFLVQACRYMAARLLEAWDESEKTVQVGHQDSLFETKHRTASVVRITPYGMSSQGGLYEQVIPLDSDERQTYALRIVAQRCLYGVDKNPLAAEMAKLSLWLLTLAKDKPFEFLDHAIRCGDSLVGIHNTEQLRKFNLDGKGEDNRLFLDFLDQKIKDAIALRRQITEMQANTVEDVEAQDRMLREANEKIDRLNCAADMLIAAEFVPGSAAEKRGARDDAAINVAVHFNDSDMPTFRREAQKALAGQVTFHWPLVFPEVMVERGGFDAFIGNPPFLGGKRISTEHGGSYERFLKGVFDRSKGAADMCCYFFRGAFRLTHSRSATAIGLLATNSIVEGDSREIGLGSIIQDGGKIFRAVRSFQWPGAAGVYAAMILISRNSPSQRCFLGDLPVTTISTHLDEYSTDAPQRLKAHGIIFSEGPKQQGSGFVLDRHEMEAMLAEDARNAEVVHPYLNAEVFNNSSEIVPSAWAIDFGTMEKLEAGKYRAPFAHLTLHVKPYRDTLTRQVHETRYWLFWDKREKFFASVKSKARILVCPRVTKYLTFRFYPPHWVFSEQIKLFDIQEYPLFSILQSSFHEAWARQYSSSLAETLRYSTSDSFDTFPFPSEKTRSVVLSATGESLYKHRDDVLKNTMLGLTGLLNRLHDPDETSPDIQKLRQLHVEMDNAVAVAYGWTDLDLDHGFHETKQGVRYTISEPARREVLARLLKLNHERYAEEVKQGLHEKKKPRKTRRNQDDSPTLFEEGES